MNDSTETTVKLYRANRLDAEYEATPDELAAQFVRALQDPAYKTSGRGSIEFEYRWWLTGPEATAGGNSSWDEADSAALLDGLRDFLDAEPDAKSVVLKAIFGEA